MSDIFKLYFGWCLYDILCLISFLTIGFHLKYKKRQIIIFYLFVAMLVAVFGNAITMDYRAYWKIIQQIIYGSQRYIHLEHIYIEIINKIGLNYILWQAIIYVPAYIIFYIIVKKLKIRRIELFLFMFVVLIMYYECIGSRQFLFVTLYYLGIISLSEKKWVVGIIILSVSAFFHKMAYMALPLTLLYFIPIKNKLTIIVLLTIFTTIIARILLVPFLDMLSILMGGNGTEYLNESTGNIGSVWWTVIGKYTHYVRLILLWYCLYVTKGLLNSTNNIQRTIYSLVFWTSCCSLFFEHIGIAGTISSRLMTLGSIGFCYLFTFVPQFKNINITQKFLFAFLMIGYWIMTNAYIKGVGNSVMLGELQLE